MDENKDVNQTPDINETDASITEASVVKNNPKPKHKIGKILFCILSYVLVAVLASGVTVYLLVKNNSNTKKIYTRFLRLEIPEKWENKSSDVVRIFYEENSLTAEMTINERFSLSSIAK